jgi:hypothetical protein
MPTWRNTTGDGLWGTAGNWLTDGSGSGVPTSGTDATFDLLSPSCTVNALNRDCRNLIFTTGYINTFTIANGIVLTVFGTAITLISSMTFNQTTTGILSTRGNQTAITITFAGIVIPNLTLGKITAGTGQGVTISGLTPTIKNLVIANGASNAGITLIGPAITITSSLLVTLGTLTNNTGQITFSGACTISSSDSSATISGGFTVGSGSSLQMISDVYLTVGTVTFTGTATLNPGTFTLHCPGIVTFNTSTVTWYNVKLNASGQIYPLLSALNISNNFEMGGGHAVSGGFPINVSGSFTSVGGGGLNLLSSTLNMLGSGTINVPFLATGILNINGTGTYIIGSITYPTFTTTNLTINLVGTSVAQVYSTSAHAITTNIGLTLRTNNTPTGANIVGGSQIIWGTISLLSNQANTLVYDTIALGNLASQSGTLNGAKLYVAGNLSVTTVISGTSTIELDGSANTTWGAGQYQNNIIVNKSGGAVVTTGVGTITWGFASRTLTINSPINFLTNSTTLSLAGGTPLTIVNTYGNSPFFNLNVFTITLNINGNPIRVNNNLTLTGSGATFAGAFGWDCNNLICSTAGPFNITLQQLVSYRTRTAVSITGGTNADRVTMRTSSIGTDAIWTLDQGATQLMIYVNGLDIDSSQNNGQTIWSFGVSPANVSTSINWNPGVPLRTVAYAFVS